MSLNPLVFRYHPLQSPGEIRIVSLRRGSGTDPIECILLHTEIHEQPYEALSYEWGLPSDDEPIILMNGFPVKVRPNLHEALRMSRFPDKDVPMWIDALCINQEDALERGHQVDLMDRIYSGADNVFVWLGEAKDDSDFAMDTFAKPRELNRLIENNGFRESERQALVALAHRSYWSRVWVLQEIYLARSYIVKCGSKTISDVSLTDALVSFCQNDGHGYCAEIASSTLNQHRMAKQFQQSNASAFNTFGRWLRVCIKRELQSSQPRDLVYALLGISQDCPRGTIVPDYDKPLLDVYRDVVVFLSRSAEREKRSSSGGKQVLHKLAVRLGLDDNDDLERLLNEVRTIPPT